MFGTETPGVHEHDRVEVVPIVELHHHRSADNAAVEHPDPRSHPHHDLARGTRRRIGVSAGCQSGPARASDTREGDQPGAGRRPILRSRRKRPVRRRTAPDRVRGYEPGLVRTPRAPPSSRTRRERSTNPPRRTSSTARRSATNPRFVRGNRSSAASPSMSTPHRRSPRSCSRRTDSSATSPRSGISLSACGAGRDRAGGPSRGAP